MADQILRSSPRRPLSDPDLRHDYHPVLTDDGTTVWDCPDCLTRVRGLPAVAYCPDRVMALRRRLELVTVERDRLREQEFNALAILAKQPRLERIEASATSALSVLEQDSSARRVGRHSVDVLVAMLRRDIYGTTDAR